MPPSPEDIVEWWAEILKALVEGEDEGAVQPLHIEGGPRGLASDTLPVEARP